MISIKPFIKTAFAFSEASNCTRLKVGAVIFDYNTRRILSTGYNGTIAGATNCNEIFVIRRILGTGVVEYTVHRELKNYLYVDFSDWEHSAWAKVSEREFKDLHHEFSEKYEIHAEQNAIYNLIKTGYNMSSSANLAIACTTEPCFQCAKAICALGIKHVYFVDKYDKYGDDSIIKYFASQDVECIQVDKIEHNI